MIQEEITPELINKIKETLLNNFIKGFNNDFPSSVVFQDGTVISCRKHPALVDILLKNKIITNIKNNQEDASKSVFFARDLNCLRMTFAGGMIKNENYVSLPAEKLTYEQEEKLLDWLYLDISKTKIYTNGYVDIVYDFKNRIRSHKSTRYNFNDYIPEEILKEIKKDYNIRINNS